MQSPVKPKENAICPLPIIYSDYRFFAHKKGFWRGGGGKKASGKG
jgi:hypothetical protein